MFSSDCEPRRPVNVLVQVLPPSVEASTLAASAPNTQPVLALANVMCDEPQQYKLAATSRQVVPPSPVAALDYTLPGGAFVAGAQDGIVRADGPAVLAVHEADGEQVVGDPALL